MGTWQFLKLILLSWLEQGYQQELTPLDESH